MSDLKKYRSGPDDLLQIIKDLERRISILERSPRVGNSAIDSGALIVNGGDIIIRDISGTDIISLLQGGTQPEIRFTPLGDDTAFGASLYAQDQIINGTTQTVGKFEIRSIPGLVPDGGSLQIYSDAVRFQHTDAGSGDVGYFEAGVINSTPGTLHIVGKWLNAIQIGATDAMLSGSVSVGAGVSSITITYTTTFATTVAPIVGLLNSGGAVSWCLTAQSTSAFTVAWSGVSAKTINLWNIRL